MFYLQSPFPARIRVPGLILACLLWINLDQADLSRLIQIIWIIQIIQIQLDHLD